MFIFNFTKRELSVVVATLILIIIATTLNLRVSYRRSRDMTRKNDIRAIHDGLLAYRDDYASFPASDQGRIVACYGGTDDKGVPQRRICEWVDDPLPDIFSMGGGTAYLEKLPSDPKHIEGRRYLYLSNGRYFQIYASLEGDDEPEYDPAIVARDLWCGNELCNFGRASDGAPLEKSIEQYENELRAKQQS